jgi:NDP-sugar pyrophosphorylase family protein
MFWQLEKHMIDIYEASRSWEKNGDWLIAPAGLSWIKEGAFVKIGKGAHIIEEAHIGAWAYIGEGVYIGKGAHIGASAYIGKRTYIGKGVYIDAWAHIGEEAYIGRGARGVIDLGFVDGYRKCIAEVDGVAYIGAGCRWFTLDDAIKHWSNKDDRVLTMCLMMAAVHIAAVKGWKTSRNEQGFSPMD